MYIFNNKNSDLTPVHHCSFEEQDLHPVDSFSSTIANNNKSVNGAVLFLKLNVLTSPPDA
jgi:hypothetical protein